MSESFWPSKPKQASGLGVLVHTEGATNMGYRIPAKLFSVKPAGWHTKDNFVHWYCNNNCKDGNSAGGCSTRDGGIMNWSDNVPENTDFRKCVLESVKRQGGKCVDAALCGDDGKGDDVCAPSTVGSFWPTKPKTASALGVVLHTYGSTNMAWRIPAELFSVKPSGWHEKDKYVHW